MTAYNFITLVKYGGANAGLEGKDINAFATFRQIKEAGYTVNKGAKGISIFCGYQEKKDSDKPVPVYACVFDIADTNAMQDTEFINWLRTEAKPVDNMQTINTKIMAKTLAGIGAK